MSCCACSFIFCFLALVVEFLYPAKESLKTLSNKGGQKQWLSYWVVFFLIFMLEKSVLCFLTWIPGYSLVKLLACLWLVHPQYLGASYLHELGLDRAFKIVNEKLQPLLGAKELKKQASSEAIDKSKST